MEKKEHRPLGSSPTVLARVYFDGLCHLCSWEIDLYRKAKGAQQLEFVDITAAGFDAEAEGLDPYAVHKSFHVRKADGSVVDGVDAFGVIWSVLPSYRPLARLLRWGPAHGLARIGYWVFARVRPWLPRKKLACSDSPYCETDSKGR